MADIRGHGIDVSTRADANEDSVKQIELESDTGKRKELITILGQSGDHRHNLAVVDARRCELLVSRRPGHSTATHMVSSFIPCCFAREQDLAKHRSYTDRVLAAQETSPNGPRLQRPILCWVGTQGRDYRGQYCVGSAPRAATTEVNIVLGQHPGSPRG